MALAYFSVVFVLSHLLLVQSAEENPRCPPFSCGKFDNISFPFFKDSHVKCGGLFEVGDCSEEFPKINLGQGIWYPLHNISQANIIRIVDELHLEDLVLDRCKSFHNLTLPHSPHFSLTIQPNITLFKCYKDAVLPSDFNYTVCHDFNIYYNGTPPDHGSQPSLPPQCSIIQLPSVMNKEVNSDDIFSFLTAEFSLQVHVYEDCLSCHSKGGQCDLCVNAERGTNNWRLKLGLGLGIGGAIIFMICFVSFVLRCRYKRKYAPEMLSRNISSDPNSKSYMDRGSVYFGVPIFSYCELEEATNNFDSNKELGDGGFGTVYHGILRDGREVAVKRLYESNYKRVEQFKNEIEILTRLHHKNLVILYGCTSRHSRELLLVYEYIPNGTVADHLHGDRATPGAVTWPIRLSIAIETANALAYLHASDIIHRDVKTNNILLDNNFCVKVADFGLSRLFPLDVTHISTAPQGTPGYVDPEYHQCYQLTEKSDVYSFGVVLIELISSLPAVDISRHRHEINLSNLAINKIQNRAYNELIDPFLGFESDPSIERMTTAVAELAFQCLQNDKEMRPSMVEVLETLKAIESGGRSHEAELIEEVGDIVGVLSSVRPPPSPESDEVVLLSKVRPPFSPVSVTEKWIISTATTPSTSA